MCGSCHSTTCVDCFHMFGSPLRELEAHSLVFVGGVEFTRDGGGCRNQPEVGLRVEEAFRGASIGDLVIAATSCMSVSVGERYLLFTDARSPWMIPTCEPYLWLGVGGRYTYCVPVDSASDTSSLGGFCPSNQFVEVSMTEEEVLAILREATAQ